MYYSVYRFGTTFAIFMEEGQDPFRRGRNEISYNYVRMYCVMYVNMLKCSLYTCAIVYMYELYVELFKAVQFKRFKLMDWSLDDNSCSVDAITALRRGYYG